MRPPRSLAQLVLLILRDADLPRAFFEENTLRGGTQSKRESTLVLDMMAESCHLKDYSLSILQGISDPDKFPLDDKHFEYEDIKP